jgi:hypothetical protein
MLGLGEQGPPAVQATQVPEPLQTMFVPQLTPGLLSVPSTQTGAPVEQAIMPFLQALFGLVVQDWPAVQATQVPEPLQTMFGPQLAPAPLLPPSTQVMAPVEQEVVPFRQMLGLPMQDIPAVQPMQLPMPLQTMLVPQLVPAIFGAPFTHIDMPVMHDATPA